MKSAIAIVDANIIVAGLITTESESPVYRILDAILAGEFPFVLSHTLLSEYRKVLLRPRITKLHGLTENDIDELLITIVTNAILLEPGTTKAKAPDPGDQHLWQLLFSNEKNLLVTGDQLLLNSAPKGRSIVTPRQFIDLFERRK